MKNRSPKEQRWYKTCNIFLMIDQGKIIYMHIRNLLFLCISFLTWNSGTTQCVADFSFTRIGNGGFEFYNNSIIADTASYDSRIFFLGDGSIETSDTFTHFYLNGGVYPVELKIETNDGCRDSISQLVEYCDLSFDLSVGRVCDPQGFISLFVSIYDELGGLTEVDILVDDLKINENPVQMVNGTANYNGRIPGDGLNHKITVQSAITGSCQEEAFFDVIDCNVGCIIQNLVINETFSGEHLIEVGDTSFSPSNRIIELGEKVIFSWIADNRSTTSDQQNGIDAWDSGIQNSPFFFEITPKNPGLKPFYSTIGGGPGGMGMSGNIIADCPESRSTPIALSFTNTAAPDEGFYLAIDGIILKDTIYAYETDGQTSIVYQMPGDNQDHILSVIDISNPACQQSGMVRSVNCNGVLPCQLNIQSSIVSRCNEDSLITLDIAVASTAPSEDGIFIVLDDSLVMDTLSFTNTLAETSIEVFGDGLLHTIKAFDLLDSNCVDSILIRFTDCSQSCDLQNLEIGTGSNNTFVVAINNDDISTPDLAISAGDRVLWQWIGDSIRGVQAFDTMGNIIWDSGLLSVNDIYLSPVLSPGIYPYQLYDTSLNVLDTFSIIVEANCEENLVPLFINFNDINGSPEGYEIKVDNVPVNGGPFSYDLSGDNQVIVRIEGDGQPHLITVQDLGVDSCIIEQVFNAPICEFTPCGVTMNIALGDTCFNDNTVPFTLEIFHPDPSSDGFILKQNNVFFEDLPYFFNGSNTFQINGLLNGDGSTYVFDFQELSNTNCTDTLMIESPICITDCNIQIISAEIITDSFAMFNPIIPDTLVGCQDSMIYAQLIISEQYSDGQSAIVLVDGEEVLTQPYSNGDSLTRIFVPILGDSTVHEIIIRDEIDINCTDTIEVFTPLCFSRCAISIASVDLLECQEDKSLVQIVLDSLTTSPIYNVLIDNEFRFNALSDTILTTVIGDSLLHSVTIIDTSETACFDTKNFVSSYCLECPISVTPSLIDSCLVGDSLGYSFFIDNQIGLDSIMITHNDSSFVYDPNANGYIYFQRVRGDLSTYEWTFSSLTDSYCFQSLTIESIDCTPIICDVDFEFEANGLQVTFTDMSTTSEPIVEQFWEIADFITVNNVSTFNYTFDSIGFYNVCHTIVTDSCTNTICKEVLAGDPCQEIIPDFTFEFLTDRSIRFINQSVGEIDEYLWNFGDNVFSASENPFHTYDTVGTYNVCLRVSENFFDCQKTICKPVDIISSSTEVPQNNIKLAPNPIHQSNESFALLGVNELEIKAEDIFLYNNQGEEISISKIEKLKNKILIFNGTPLPQGIYFVIIKNNGHIIFSNRLMVIH